MPATKSEEEKVEEKGEKEEEDERIEKGWSYRMHDGSSLGNIKSRTSAIIRSFRVNTRLMLRIDLTIDYRLVTLKLSTTVRIVTTTSITSDSDDGVVVVAMVVAMVVMVVMMRIVSTLIY